MTSIFNNVPAPPLIPSSTNLDDNTTRKFITLDTKGTKISDGQAYFEGGFLRNLNDPVEDRDIATKNYIDNLGGGGTPGGVNTNIQINDGAGGFSASNDFVFSNISGATSITGNANIGVITIDGLISNIVNPTNPQDAATKNYVDTKTRGITNVNFPVEFGSEVFFTPDQVYNTIINLETIF